MGIADIEVGENDMRIFGMWIVLGLMFPGMAFAKDFRTDFSKRSNQYKIPHRHNTTRDAAKRVDGILSMAIKPGMHGAGNDQRAGKERAEYGIFLNDRDAWVRQTFRIRAASGFPTNTRTMISQIKFSDAPKGLGSPPIAVYLSEGGAVKCNDYSSGRPSQNHRRIRGVRLDDGNWHTVVMELVLSDTNGYCRVVIDGKVMIELRGIDTHQNGEELVARIGPYRDETSITQVVQFDDWTVQSSRQVPNSIGQ